MAIKKSTYTGQTGRKSLHSPYQAHVPASTIIEHSFVEAVGPADILELAYLPPFCRVLEAELLTEGTGAATVDVGFMSGDPGSNDPDRTSGTELFDAAEPADAQRASLADLVAIEAAKDARSIGVTFSAAVAANPATKLYLKLTYATGAY